MNIHEYQGKAVLNRYGVPVPAGIVAATPEEAVEAAKKLNAETGTKFFVVKAQVHAGGRGKGGGVKLAKSYDEVREHASNIIGMQLVTPQTTAEGKLVSKVLIQEDVYYPGDSEIRELYISVLLNRATGRNMIMYSPQGGMDIEQVAEETPELIFTEEIDPKTGILPFQARRVAFNLGLEGLAHKNMQKFITALSDAYVKADADLVEINPAVKTSDDKILAVDAKVGLDENALFRHKDYNELHDPKEEDPYELEASQNHLNFVKLDGNVGCMVNGAGLAMATMDIIKQSGGSPANFLDVGGGASVETVEAGFRIIMKDPNVQAILINIFGGIVHCDKVAKGVVEAYHKIGDIQIPIIVRLQGNRAAEGKEVLDNSGLKVYSAITLQEAADRVKELVK